MKQGEMLDYFRPMFFFDEGYCFGGCCLDADDDVIVVSDDVLGAGRGTGEC